MECSIKVTELLNSLEQGMDEKKKDLYKTLNEHVEGEG